MKKFILMLSFVLSIGFMGCGGGDSDEAKALLQKILQLVGIPQHIVANVCQDKNRNGLCETLELQAKITIKKGDDIDDIWAKITQTEEGRYFLETYDATLPILLELQDASKVNSNDGKFALNFNGFQTNENNETKEISLLEAMIDANALEKKVADKFRTLENQEAQDKYYNVLLESLETNINILSKNGLNSKKTVTASIKEMGDETRDNQIQADRINACKNNQSCVDEELKKLSDELIITEEESNQITQGEGNQAPLENNHNKIDMATYKPTSSMFKNYIEKYKFKDEEEEHTEIIEEEITVENNVISIVTYTNDEDDDIDIETISITEDSIKYEWNENKYKATFQRYINIGDISFKYKITEDLYEECILVEKLSTFSHGGYTYSGDIIKEKCTGYNSSYIYSKKDLGLIVSVNNDDSFDYFNEYYVP